MLAPREALQQVPLIAFLDAYPEPAFIICSNTIPQSSLDFLYGNSALHELLFGHDDTGVLDDQTFFSAVASDEDLFWLSDPTRGGSSTSVGDSHTIHVRPAWLPRDHTSLDLELTPTPIDMPVTIPGIGSTSCSYVIIASPRKTPMNLLRSETHSEPPRRRDPGLRLPDFPPFPASAAQRRSSRKTRSESTSWPSQPAAVIKSEDLPSTLVNVYPWEKTALGPKESWPLCLRLAVQYIMEKPVPCALFWGWPDQVMLYNDVYAKMIGNKHPGIFGKNGSVAWGELWEMLSPVSDLIRKGKSTHKVDDQLFFHSLTEMHLPEEVYHSWHWTPVWQEDGSVGGALNSTWETTQKVIAERRLSGMSDLFSKLADARTQKQFGERALDTLSKNPLDLPFVALYWCDVENSPSTTPKRTQKGPALASTYLRHHSSSLVNVTLTLAGSVGIPSGHPIARHTIKYTLDSVTFQPAHIGSDSASDSLASPAPSETTPRVHAVESPIGSIASSTLAPLSAIPKQNEHGLDYTRVFMSGGLELVDPLPGYLAQGLDGRGFRDTPRTAAILPISAHTTQNGTRASGRTLPRAIVLFGLNTRRPYDADYAAWLESLGAGLSNQLSVVLQREADLRMIEERERMDKAKTMFFTNVSHELRTPLTLVQAPLEQLLTSQGINREVLYRLQLAMRNCKRLKKLIDSIMDMSKLEAGRLVGNFRPVQLGRVTADLAALFRSIAEKKGLDLEISCDMTEEPIVYVDIDLWEKIVCNLLSNAFKYTTTGTISVSVTHDGLMSYVRVSDTGVGIPHQYLDQVFERFFRVNNNSAEGTGVGLSLTKELVSLHGGQMHVESRTNDKSPGNSGSTFTVVIPHGHSHLPTTLVHDAAHTNSHGVSQKEMEYWMELDQPTPSSAASASDEGESATSSTLFFEKDDVILVADDNSDMRAYVRKIFAPYLTVVEAHNGEEALHVAKTTKLNLILWQVATTSLWRLVTYWVLSDVMMPVMDGIELLQRLREERRTKILPVIFVTASDDIGLFGGNAEGVVDCISKPFRVRDLLARVHLQLQLGKRRVKLEEDFEVRSHELHVLTDLSPVAIFRTDSKGKMLYVNPAWYQVTAFPQDRDRDEWIDYIHPRSKEDVIRMWRACFEDRKSSSMRVQWKNSCWTHLGISPLISPEDDMLGVFGAITDINEQHRAEEARIALAEEREHIAASRAEEAEEQRLLEVERRRAQELLIDVTSHELRQPVSAIIQNAEVVQTNMKGLRDLLSDCRKRNICYAPTERMLNELEDDLQAMESITQCGLAQARIANDVLSLSRIQLNVLSIIPTEFDIRRETSQILMVFRNELMSKEIELKLDLGRGVERFGLQVVSTDRSRYAQIITNLMSNAIRFTDMSNGLREIKVSLELSPSPPSDESCAAPLTIPGRWPTSPPPDSSNPPIYIYVSVQDTGPGLHKEDLALLFQRFQQGSNAHHVFGGSGLGLFVCRQLCGLMGGRIEVVSELGQGATFRFFIRASTPSGRNPQPPITGRKPRRSASVHSKGSGVSKGSTRSISRPLPETPNMLQNRPLHVLITEDNKINQTVLARQMKRAGFTFSLASNGLESIQAIDKANLQEANELNAQQYDVVLMDLEMPVMDGFAATREIRRRESTGTLRKRSFIIALTGNARLEQVQAARDAGVDDVMIKPYQIDALILKMRAGYQVKTDTEQ